MQQNVYVSCIESVFKPMGPSDLPVGRHAVEEISGAYACSRNRSCSCFNWP